MQAHLVLANTVSGCPNVSSGLLHKFDALAPGAHAVVQRLCLPAACLECPAREVRSAVGVHRVSRASVVVVWWA